VKLIRIVSSFRVGRSAYANGGPPDGVPLVAALGLTTGYSRAVAVISDVDIEVLPGEVVGLFGANGAGKTTTLLSLAGELAPHSGEVVVDGVPSRAPLHRRAREGLAFVTEERSVFTDLSAADNLRVGGGSEATALTLFPELRSRLKVRGGMLSGGEQQMLTLARALSRDPRLLLADELSLGLAPMIVDRLLQAIRVAADQRNAGVLLVEQHVRKALKHVDRGYVLRGGRVVLTGSAAELRAQIDEIERAYLHVAASS
jgi:branched-chain amino acid transport system ATP-binding protein